MGPMTQTPRAQAILEEAERLAGTFGHSHLGTEHLLLALAMDNGGVAASVLSELSVADAIIARVNEIIASPGYSTTSVHPRGD